MTNQNRLLKINIFFENQSPNLFGDSPPLYNIKCALRKKSMTPYPNTQNSFSFTLSCRENFFLDKLINEHLFAF